MNLIEQFAKHLEFLGFGDYASEESDGNIFWANLPDKPDEAICVFSEDSGYPGSTSGARIQIYTRGEVGDAKMPYETACRITEEVRGFVGFLCGDGAYVRIDVTNSAQGMGLDDSGRHIFSSNYVVYYCDY